MTFLEVLPLAVVMVAGPQLLSAIFLATSRDWRRNSTAFVAGGGLAISTVVTAAYVLGVGARREGASSDLVNLVVLGLLLVGIIQVYRTRAESEPPKWMGRLERATPQFSFKLGVLLLGVFPTDLVTAVTVGSFLSANGRPLTDAVGYVSVTLLLLSLPALGVASLGRRAETVLPRVRDWMTENSWLVNELVLLLFVAIVAGNLWG